MPQLVPVDYDPFDRPSMAGGVATEPGQDPLPADLPDVVRRVIGPGQGIPEDYTPPLMDPAKLDLWRTERGAVAHQDRPRDEQLREWLGVLRDRNQEGWPRDQGLPGLSEGQPPRATSISDVHLVPVDHDPFSASAYGTQPDPSKIGAGPETPLDTALRAGIIGAGGSDVVNAIRQGGKVFPALQRGESGAAVGAGLSALLSGALLGAGVVAPENKLAGIVGENALTKGIRAYHGSPYDFSAFDMIAGGAASVAGNADAATHVVPVDHDPFAP